MFGERPKFKKPGGNDTLYPTKEKEAIPEKADTTLVKDADSSTAFVYNRYHHLPISTQRQKLPVFQSRNHILYLLERYQTLILVGDTGCGKSTQVPQYLLEVGHRVCVTQPRVSAAVALASRVAEERGQHCGQQVGYAVSMDTSRGPDTELVFMTEGVLLREMFASPLLTQYSCIVLDEVHERTQLTDVLMGLLKKIARKRKNLKLVISSATMDTEFLKDFFNLKVGKKRAAASSSTILSIQGRTHPVDLYYVEEPVPNYVKATIDTITKIHENEPFGDVLAFLTSQEEILTALQTLSEYASDCNNKNIHRKHFPSGIRAADMSVLPMYGSLPHYKQLKVFQMADKGVRKVILATNIAETSITIPGITYVVDCGFHKLPFFDPALGVESLVVCEIAQSNALQRAGRAGRTTKGKCFRLYTEEQYDKMLTSVPPEMLRSDLSSILLQLKALGIHNLLRFTFPTPPPAKLVLSGLEMIYALEAIDKSGQLTSPLGLRMSELPLKPMLAKMLCCSGEWGCIDEILSIVAMVQVESVFQKPSQGSESIKARVSRRNNFEVAEGDLVMYLNVYDAYIRHKESYGRNEKAAKKGCRTWCRKMYVNDRAMEKVCEIRKGLEKLVKEKFGIENKTFDGLELGSVKTERICKAVSCGLFPTASYLHAGGQYRTAGQGAGLALSPDSCLYDAQQPQWVVFASVQCSNDKTYMREVTVIKKEWLLELAPHYFTES